jgi:hypothetical protein
MDPVENALENNDEPSSTARRTAMKSLSIGTLAVLVSQAMTSEGAARELPREHEDRGRRMGNDTTPLERAFQMDVNHSVTVGMLTKQVAEIGPAFLSKVWCKYNYCVIIRPGPLELTAPLPHDIEITDSMTLDEAMAVVARSRHADAGIYVTADGLRLSLPG